MVFQQVFPNLKVLQNVNFDSSPIQFSLQYTPAALVSMRRSMRIIKVKWFACGGFFTAIFFWFTVFSGSRLGVTFYNTPTFQHAFSYKLPHSSNNDTLVNLYNFQYVINNASLCGTAPYTGTPSSLLILIHSARPNFNQRYAIRNTWGSIKLLKLWHIHLVFLLGIDTEYDTEIDGRLLEESKQHGDMVMGNFVDTYENLTYKHLMGYKWATTFCRNTKFILKTDDDLYADIFQVVEVLLPEFVNSKKTFSCENMRGNQPVRDTTSRWYISEDLYPGQDYPHFCSGTGYLMTSDGAARIYSASNKTKFLWIDDVFVTGILREKYDVLVPDGGGHSLDILSLQDKHNIQHTDAMLDWCKRGVETSHLNYTFVVLYKHRIISEMFCMWNKVRQMRFAMNAAISMETN